MRKIFKRLWEGWCFFKDFHEHHAFWSWLVLVVPTIGSGLWAWLDKFNGLAIFLICLIALAAMSVTLAGGAFAVHWWRRSGSLAMPDTPLPPKAQSPTPADRPYDEMLPLREAVGIALQATRQSTLAAFHAGYGSDEAAIVFGYFSAMLDRKTPIYGKTPPAADWVLLTRVDLSKETLWEMKAIKPHHGPIRITDLSVKRTDLAAFVNAVLAEDGNVTQENWRPLHEAVGHISQRIGDTDEEQCYPLTLKALRQQAVNGKMRIRGRKQLDIQAEMRFSDIHTSVPKEYWENSEIGAMATSPAYANRDFHTNPETPTSWGRYNAPNHYSSLLVDWRDVVRLWP